MRMAAELLLLVINLQLLVSLIKLPREPVPGDPGTVILTKKLLYSGLAFALIMEAPAVIMFIMDVHPKAVLNFSILSLFGAAMMRGYTNIRIYYDDEGFRKFYFLGYSRYFRYEELTGIHGKVYDVKFYAGKRVIRVSVLANRLRFLYIAKRRYRHTHDGKDIPKVKDLDIFRGNLVNPGVRSIILIIFMLIPIIFELIGVIDYFIDKPDKPIPIEELELVEGRVKNVEDIYGGTYFSIENRDEHFCIDRSIVKEPEETLEYLRSGGTVKLGCVRCKVGFLERDAYKYKYKTYYGAIFLKTGDGRDLLTQEDWIEFRKTMMRRSSIFELILFSIWESVCALFLLVGRYPNRFPLELVSFLYDYESFTVECRKNCKLKR